VSTSDRHVASSADVIRRLATKRALELWVRTTSLADTSSSLLR